MGFHSDGRDGRGVSCHRYKARAQTAAADPVFLIHGFSDSVVDVPTKARVFKKTTGKSALLNPRRYGAIRFSDYARYRLSVFAREEAAAIVEYSEYRRDAAPKALFMTVWCPDSRSVESNCGIPRG